METQPIFDIPLLDASSMQLVFKSMALAASMLDLIHKTVQHSLRLASGGRPCKFDEDEDVRIFHLYVGKKTCNTIKI